MAIEQSVYGYCKKGQESGSGWGYYSYSPLMKLAKDSSEELKALTCQFQKPRNNWVWTTGDVIYEEEEQNIEKYHPVSFCYREIEVNGKAKIIFRFAKNLGRDYDDRTGNMMINTLLADPSDVQGYPCFYHNSVQLICLEGEKLTRSFFETRKIQANLLTPHEQLIPGEELGIQETIAFMREESEHVQILQKLFRVLISNGEKTRIIFCDQKDRIIRWIAAVSILFPVEMAQKISFNTYSYLEQYDNVMLCGVYSPSVNGDTRSDGRPVTQYDPMKVKEDNTVYLFDMEQNMLADVDCVDYGFCDLIGQGFESADSYQKIQEFHQFLLEKTNCRTIGSGYLQAYALYCALQKQNLKNDAVIAAIHFAIDHAANDVLLELYHMFGKFVFHRQVSTELVKAILCLIRSCIKNQLVPNEVIVSSLTSGLLKIFQSADCDKERFLCCYDQVEEIYTICKQSLNQSFLQQIPVKDTIVHVLHFQKEWRGVFLLQRLGIYFNFAAQAEMLELYRIVAEIGYEKQVPAEIMDRAIQFILLCIKHSLLSKEQVHNDFLRRIADIFIGNTDESYFLSCCGNLNGFFSQYNMTVQTALFQSISVMELINYAEEAEEACEWKLIMMAKFFAKEMAEKENDSNSDEKMELIRQCYLRLHNMNYSVSGFEQLLITVCQYYAYSISRLLPMIEKQYGMLRFSPYLQDRVIGYLFTHESDSSKFSEILSHVQNMPIKIPVYEKMIKLILSGENMSSAYTFYMQLMNPIYRTSLQEIECKKIKKCYEALLRYYAKENTEATTSLILITYCSGIYFNADVTVSILMDCGLKTKDIKRMLNHKQNLELLNNFQSGDEKKVLADAEKALLLSCESQNIQSSLVSKFGQLFRKGK